MRGGELMESTDPLQHQDVGYLTMRDWNRAKWAYDYAVTFLPWLRVAGYVNFDVQDVRVDSSNTGTVGIPATKLSYIDITGLMEELNKWPELEDAAHDSFGHELLILLGREMSTAVARWPMEDKPHRVDALRCGGCEQLTLIYRPPRWEGDRIKVDCMCGYVLEEEEFAWAVDLIEREERERELGERGRGREKSAEVEADRVPVGA